MKSKLIVLSVIVAFTSMAMAIDVPNGDFETLYKPGTMIPGILSVDAWTYGVGPDIQTESGNYDFADTSTGTVADIPGWVGYDVQTWLDLGGTYGRQDMDPLPGADVGNLQGSIGRQGSFEGVMSYLSNGGGWGNPAGGLITSEASLGAATGEPLTLAMVATGGANPAVLDLLANGVALVPTAAVDPVLDATWQAVTRTYDAATMAAVVGQDLTIVLGVGRNATGGQTKFDAVTLDVVPEPATMALLALGGLVLRRRRK